MKIRSLDDILEDYKNEIVSQFKKRGLITIAIYGPGYLKKAGDRVETWLVFDSLDMKALTQLHNVWKKYSPYNFSTPFVTLNYEVTGMDDSFPLQAIEGLYGYKVIWGEDIFKNIRVKPQEHRAQVEFELRNKLINMRIRWVETEIPDDQDRMNLLYNVYEDVLFCSRITVLLKDRKTVYESYGLFEKIQQEYKLPKRMTKRILSLLKTLEEKPTVSQKRCVELYHGAVEFVSYLLKRVDEMEKDFCK